MSALFVYSGTPLLSVSPGSAPNTDPHTIMGWCNPSSTANFNEQVEVNTSSGGISVLASSGGTTEICWRMSNSTFSAFTDLTANVNTNEWHFVCGTYDGTTMRLYVDGVASGTATPGYGTRTGTWGQCQVGPTDGSVQDARFYSAVLSAAEIANEYRTRQPKRTTNLEMWYPLFAGSSQRLVDWSGKGRNLTQSGTVNDGTTMPAVAWGTGYHMFLVSGATQNVVAAGASSGAGSAAVTQDKAVTAAGASLGAGSAVVGQGKDVLASGGSLSAGSAIVTQLKAIVASGGSLAAGSVVVTGGGTGGGGGASTIYHSSRQRFINPNGRRTVRR